MHRRRRRNRKGTAQLVNKTLELRVLPTVLAELDKRDRVSILDLGVGTAATVRFFSRYDCQIYFADLAEDALPKLSGTGVQLPFDLPSDHVFDVCLFWDFLNCMSDGFLSTFSAKLRPHIGPKTAMHGFFAYTSLRHMPYGTYAIESHDRVQCRTLKKPTVVQFPRTFREVTRVMNYIEAKTAVLLQENRQEVLATGVG